MEILPESTSNSSADQTMALQPHSRRQLLVEVVVTATVVAAAIAVVRGGCDGGDFGEVERRRGSGVHMMMMAVVVMMVMVRGVMVVYGGGGGRTRVAAGVAVANGVNILKSIDEGPFRMGTLRETLTEGTEGALHLGPEQPRVYSELRSEEKDRYNANIWATNILFQGLPKDIYSLINHYTDAKDIWDNVKMLME
nr:integrase, catalytic region, zinc finger, CCHC-type, peptidase aspartic, catalytic [Tanacetum cinerariifolium]